MALSPARMWTLFRAIRVLVYSIATLVSMGIAGIYALLLIRGWDSFNGDQRAIVIVLLVVYAVSTIMMYLMLIFRFRLWLDGTRLAILVFAQVGGSVTFDVFYPSLPCKNLGSESTCKMVETIAIFGGWALSGLLSLFALYLAVMHYIPVPTRRPNPEAILTLQLASDGKREKGSKRASMNSTASGGSDYSQKSHITPYTYSPSPEVMKSRRSPSIRYVVEAPVDQYRVRTPGSIHSSSASSNSTTSSSHTIRPAPSQFDYNRPATPGSLRSADPGATLGSHANRPVPTYDYNQSGAPSSLRSAETGATLGSHTNKSVVPTYNRDYAGTPISVRSGEIAATLGSHTNRPAPTYDYGHSRAQGSTGSTETGASHGSHTARIPPFEHYRAPTPAMSVRSVALTSASSIRTVPRQRYNQNHGIPAPQPLLAPDNYPPLTQAFREPISRNGTPLSSLSNTSFYTNRLPAALRSPPLAPVGPGYSFPQPPMSDYRTVSPISPTASLPSEEDESRPPFIAPATPAPMGRQAQLREAILRSPSPSVYSGQSTESMLQSPSRNESIVPRSPSPETVSFHNLPTTPQAAVLPARPDLSPAMYTGRYGTPVPETQRPRFGSVPEINVNDLPVRSNQHYRTDSDYHGGAPPRKWSVSPPRGDRADSIDQWRQNLAYTPRPSESRRM